MKRLKYILLLFIISSCTNNEIIKPTIKAQYKRHINAELHKYLDLFLDEAKQRGYVFDKKIGMRYDSMKGRAGFWDGKDVVININWKNEQFSYAKERLLFHELAHAYLGYNHPNAHLDRDQYGIHIMNVQPVIGDVQHYIDNREEMINNLFYYASLDDH